MFLPSETLQQLLSLLVGAERRLSRAIVRRNNCTALHNLALYYQMVKHHSLYIVTCHCDDVIVLCLQETRASLRLLLLQVFGALCELDALFLSELLNSVLPLELARDLTTDTTSKYIRQARSYPR